MPTVNRPGPWLSRTSRTRRIEPTDADIPFSRRLRRDLGEWGRTLDIVSRQYEETVRSLHLEFVKPSKRWAHLVVPEEGHDHVDVEMLVATIRAPLGGSR